MTTPLISTNDGGATWIRTPEFVTTGATRQVAQDMADRGEWTDLIGADPPTYRQWTETGAAWLGYTPWAIEANPELADNIPVAARYLAGTPEEREAAQRQSLSQQIEAQIPVYNASETLIDTGKERDVARAAGAASDKQVELEETAAGDLDAFDTTLAVADPQADVAYSRFTVTIAELAPWAGAPDNDLGFVATLETEEGQEAEGAEARLYVAEGADTGAVLPFVQDTENPALWTVESRDGQKWYDPEQGTAVQLLWGAGSLKVSGTLRCEREYDRQAAGVRYGVASGAARGTGRIWR